MKKRLPLVLSVLLASVLLTVMILALCGLPRVGEGTPKTEASLEAGMLIR